MNRYPAFSRPVIDSATRPIVPASLERVMRRPDLRERHNAIHPRDLKRG